MASHAKSGDDMGDWRHDAATVGLAVRVFEPTPLAAVIPALAWRTFIRQLQALTHRDHEDEQKPSGD